jgi:tRNA G46 methylase TrmB
LPIPTPGRETAQQNIRKNGKLDKMKFVKKKKCAKLCDWSANNNDTQNEIEVEIGGGVGRF